jgi:hypothetical protein
MLNALVLSLLGEIKITIPWDALRAIPADVVAAVGSGDTAPLRQHVAEALDEAVDLSKVPLVGAMAEHEQEALAVAVVDHVAATLGADIASGALPLTGGKARRLAATVVSTQAEADAVLGMGPIWRATHPAMVAAAKAYGA